MDARERSATRSRRGRPNRAEQVATRRRALLDAAGVVFRRDGYLAASVDSIAEAAQLTKGAVYSQFDSKADLFLNLLEERIDERAAENDAAARSRLDSGSPQAFMEAGANAVRDPAWHLALIEFRVVAARVPELNARYARVHAVAVAGLARSLTALYEGLHRTPPMDVEMLAIASLALEAGGLLELVVADEPLPEAAMLDLGARLLDMPIAPRHRPEDP